MSVFIKDLSVAMEVKNKGVEFGVADNDGKQIGDLIIKKTGLVWCKGKTSPKKGVRISWDEFIEWAES